MIAEANTMSMAVLHILPHKWMYLPQYIVQIQSLTEAKGFLFVCFLYLKFSLTSLAWEIPKPCNNFNQPLYGFLLLVSFAGLPIPQVSWHQP